VGCPSITLHAFTHAVLGSSILEEGKKDETFPPLPKPVKTGIRFSDPEGMQG